MNVQERREEEKRAIEGARKRRLQFVKNGADLVRFLSDFGLRMRDVLAMRRRTRSGL